jgi:Flp pilus assembly protein TadG
MRGLQRRPPRLCDRRGVTVVLFAILLPVFLGLMALSIDISVLALGRNQLSTAADAGALAGAMKLATENRVRAATNLSPEIVAANSQAASIAQANAVLRAAPVVVQDPYNNGGGDIRVGYLDPANNTSTLVTDSSQVLLFNSVEVTMRRDASHVAPIPNFFGKLMGFNGSDVTMRSTATAFAYKISGVKAIDGATNANLLPIVLDVNTYNSMMARDGTTTDQYTYNSATNTVTSGSDGIYESQLYPVKNGPGNWGTINIGVSNEGTSTLEAQIRYGITPAQMATYPNSTIALDSTKTPPQITFSANPGISAGIKDGVESIIGKPVIIPIYDPVLSGGNGANASYGVIKFQAVRIVASSFQGNPKYVIIQPCLINDPTAIADLSDPNKGKVWTSGGVIKIHLSR